MNRKSTCVLRSSKIFMGILAITALLVFSLSGCGSSQQSASGGTKTVTDDTGRTVEVPAKITSYLPAGYPAQIVLYALAPDKCIGLAQELNDEEAQFFGEDFANLDYVGSIYGSKGDINSEAVLALNPDVIIDIGEAKEGIVDDLNKLQDQLGIPILHYDCGLAEMDSCFTKLGELLGMEKDAAKLADFCAEASSVAQEFAANENKVSGLYLIGDQGLNVIASGSYHAQVLDAMFDNVAVVDSPSSKGTGNEIDIEQLYNWDPEVILFAPNSVFDSVASDPNWQQLTAISTDKYYEVPLGPLNWVGFPPSIQRILGMYWMGTLLYPDLADYDLQEVVTEYFDLFYHHDLTQSEYDELVANSIGKVESSK